jgi:hypothetical protein
MEERVINESGVMSQRTIYLQGVPLGYLGREPNISRVSDLLRLSFSYKACDM